ncbi:MAG: esterase-like activity of phytase family protein [Planctomyces sp.]
MPSIRTFLLLALLLLHPRHTTADDGIQLIGTAAIPGDQLDLSNDTRTLENGERVNRLGGLSALDYAPRTGLLAALSDRGPDDGAVSYPCRFQLFELLISPGRQPAVTLPLKHTVPLTDASGKPLTGRATILAADSERGRRFDPEGFRFGPDGRIFISDEYGPEIVEFNSSGREVRSLPLPPALQVATPHGDRKIETEGNSSGRASNRGMECLAVSPDGKHLYGLMQGPLIQDGTRKDGKVVGTHCRLLQLTLQGEPVAEYVYVRDSPDNGNSELLALPDGRLLVLERDGNAGEKAAHRKLIAVSLTGATSVAGMTTLPRNLRENNIQPVTRTVLLDLLDPRWKLAGKNMPEKIEGLTLGPPLPDGRQTLILSSDNDFESQNASLLWVFALPPGSIPAGTQSR